MTNDKLLKNNAETSLNNDGSDDEDSAPESISFDAAKKDNTEQSFKIKEQINFIRESQKRKRKERQDKYIQQKQKKLENLKLSEDLLEKLEKLEKSNETSVDESASTKNELKNRKSNKQTKKIFHNSDDDEDDVKKLKAASSPDFIPIKTFKNYGISVVNLKEIDRKPLISSERALMFKNAMHNGKHIHRETAQERLRKELKRKLVK